MATKEICMLARKWSGENPSGWLMSEKFDGIRAIRPRGGYGIVSREDNRIAAPDWWLAQLPPDIFLDGELWVGRGKFQETQSIVQKPVPVDEEWERIKFMCIQPWEWADWSRLYRHFRPIQQTTCKSREHLHEFYDSIVEGGGEGVILRHPIQPYHCGRSPYLLKIKPERKGVATVVARSRSR